MPIAKAVTCPVCGSLCDDIELRIKNRRIVQVKNGCSMCESKFLGYSGHRLLKPLIRKNGILVEAPFKEALANAAEVLAEANYPVLYGWSSTSCEATRVGIELAEEVGGVIDNTSTVCHGPSVLGIQDVGISSCTLGQIRHRADLVIYWGSNPWSAHPRHIERYTTLSEGKFERSEWKSYVTKTKAATARKKVDSALRQVSPKKKPYIPLTAVERGPCPAILKAGRKLIVIDVRKTRTAEIADYFIQVEPNKDYELLQAFRALVRDQEIETDKVAGVPVEYLEDVAEAMINCNFGVIFFGLGLTMSKGKSRNVDAALSLTRDLNARTKFVIMPMRGHFNVSGADTVFLWQTGYPYAVDFSSGYPRYNPGETSVIDVLLRKESDAALVIASDPVSNFPRKAAEHLVNNPLIAIDPHMNATSQMADIVFPSAFVGIEASGTAYRMDHVPLPLKKVVEPPKRVLSDEEILRRMLLEVRKVKKRRKLNQGGK
ncbi:MAG: formylmethanofuran dehydrogenase subunit B [Candidatus Bathyarchaeia archaeon]|jgi:formylmethanofuran dehydrogenase subunit B